MWDSSHDYPFRLLLAIGHHSSTQIPLWNHRIDSLYTHLSRDTGKSWKPHQHIDRWGSQGNRYAKKRIAIGLIPCISDSPTAHIIVIREHRKRFPSIYSVPIYRSEINQSILVFAIDHNAHPHQLTLTSRSHNHTNLPNHSHTVHQEPKPLSWR